MELMSSTLPLLCHPRVDVVERETNEYFIANWPFPDIKSREKFVGGGFTRCTCMYFPKARDDRIHFACRLLTVLFLIDDVLEELSFEEGRAYNGLLMALVRGERTADRSVAVQRIFHDLWTEMRASDAELAEAIVEPLFIFMRAQTDDRRAQPMSFMQYLEYRDKDIGQALLCALMRFVLDIRLGPAALALVHDADVNCGKHIAIINDIWSFEKEARTAQSSSEEGSVLCNGVAILAHEAGLSTAASKRVLHLMCLEWEDKHRQLMEDLVRGGGQDEVVMTRYFEGLAYQMSGNVAWSKLTHRYQM
ncbi:Aristolochene synthase in complex with 12,13-Difluorofarnesyl diphosphate [Astrocystis sublimbata]|nr:Aristolochene synthase in complex with 12,13-Difluorofarnesyl diphosphate [Astrocystis sublimbata]